MSWVDSMRLRRRADKVRAGGWFILGVAVLIALVEHDLWILSAACAAAGMAVTYALAYWLDVKAERVITR